MKVDEIVTIYQLLTQQTYITLPFCILAVYGILELLFGWASKRIKSKYKALYVISYFILLMISLCMLINQRNRDEDLRKDALRVKQYMDQYAGDYGGVYLKNVADHFRNIKAFNIDINDEKIIEIANKFPDDFILSSDSNGGNSLYISLADTAIMNPHKRFMEKLAYIKLKSSLANASCVSMDTLFNNDTRITYKYIEKVCGEHPDEFTIINSGHFKYSVCTANRKTEFLEKSIKNK